MNVLQQLVNTNFKDAVRRDEAGWMKSMHKEILNHASNHSWSYVPRADLPRGRRVVRLIWVYKVGTPRG